MPEGPNSAYDVGRGLSQAFTSGGPLFPVVFSFIASGGILFVNSDKKYAKNAVAGTDSATDPLPLPLRRRSVWVYGFEYGFPRRVYAPARNDRIIL